uniref:HA2 domain-containing protein n=1 Tax=Globodera pallida TaxID=36090 RepID=A0A183C890_GLOPA
MLRTDAMCGQQRETDRLTGSSVRQKGVLALGYKGIDVVIDSGKVKVRARGGREGPGKCYRLYSLANYNRLADEQEPELQRCRLLTVLLELVELGVLVHLLSPPGIDQLRAAKFYESNNLNERHMDQVWSIRKQLYEEFLKHKLHFSTSPTTWSCEV